jgi:hypothetical protein
MQAQITSLKQLLAKPLDGNLLADKCTDWKQHIKTTKDYFSKMATIADSLASDVVGVSLQETI